ncbi:HNH endonuclease [Gordonia phage Bantam]|uniref:HNH endonuclease n=1 Tax=Gordonia phage Bantam TaxID=1887641 RepID=A0A1B3AYH2_9CAUD|nr:HNH endonuclease [Gordonia phage Bantam]AOE43791.1 HNH endonuclease [Gordonia phage Bantam]
MTEEWRPVPGWETHYQVSSAGNVRSIDRVIDDARGYQRAMRGKDLSPATHRDGYRFVNLRRGDEQLVINVRQLVAAAFLDHPLHDKSRIIVNRDESSPADDSVDNLKLVDALEFRRAQAEHAREMRPRTGACRRGHQIAGPNAANHGGREVCRSCHLARNYVSRNGLPKDQLTAEADRYYQRLTGADQAVAA